MKIEVKADIDEAVKGLSNIGKKIVPKASLSALRVSHRNAFMLARRYAAKDFKITQKKVRTKKIVDTVRPSKNRQWFSVWFNPYPDAMNTRKGYTLADTKNSAVRPRPGKSVIGEPFAAKFKGVSGNMFVQRDSRKGRTKFKIKKGKGYTSSQVNTLYFTRRVRNAERTAMAYTLIAERRFRKEFARQMDWRLRQEGLV